MRFVLAGFRQDQNIRHYSFQGIGDDRRTRTEFTVGVDLTLLHKHRIPLQEAPLLCCDFLASRVGDELHSLMFSENEMLVHAEQRARERAESQADRKPKSLASLSSPDTRITPSSPLLIDSRSGRSGIGLGSRAGLPLSQ